MIIEGGNQGFDFFSLPSCSKLFAVHPCSFHPGSQIALFPWVSSLTPSHLASCSSSPIPPHTLRFALSLHLLSLLCFCPLFMSRAAWFTVVSKQRLSLLPLLPTYNMIYQSAFALLPHSLMQQLSLLLPLKSVLLLFPLALHCLPLLTSALFLYPSRLSQTVLSLFLHTDPGPSPPASPILFHAPPPHQSLSTAALKQDKWIWISYNKTFRMESFVQVNSSQAWETENWIKGLKQ